MGTLIRARTYVEHDDTGWWCAFQMFSGETAEALVPFGDPIRVGPWPSRQVARRELRGDFRRIITEATRAYAAKIGGRVIAEAYDGVEFTPAELNAAAGIKP